MSTETYRGGSRSARRTATNPTVYVKVFMSRSERTNLRERANISSKSMSQYVRDRVFGGAGAAPSTQLLDDVQRELRLYSRQLVGEATNINQIAHHANAASQFPEQADELRMRVYEQLEAISTMLGKLEAWK